MFKRIVARVLLFGIPFTAAYVLNRPTPAEHVRKTPIVCAYPGDRPGELRITLEQDTCKERTSLQSEVAPHPALAIPATQSFPEAPRSPANPSF
jgi:hypothetical protein